MTIVETVDKLSDSENENPPTVLPGSATPSIDDKQVADKKSNKGNKGDKGNKSSKGKGSKGTGKTKSSTKGTAKAKSKPSDRGKGMKRPAAAAMQFGETMGGEPPADPGDEPVPDRDQTNVRDNYTLMLYKSRNIAAVRETQGSKKQVLQVDMKATFEKVTVNVRTFRPTRRTALFIVREALRVAGLQSQLRDEKECSQEDVPDILGRCFREAWSGFAKDAGRHLRSAGFREVATNWTFFNAKTGDILVLPVA
eukprot:s123_g17.t2